ncbi:hypothetical protein M430DRAFT_212642 [Amorphotheca resinae ATCC 22711]|jgi:hypothetical protein|uniref:Secreted protein n=1 Tax=Amorphotheca resinae ATCC 22711 TaxID=857342 RepID=A0A2T3B884_AMORE|nr:hypothetical protein M430DRAFT_212642 [Amorphotheca resinae ATCC 22711]PSS23051.1 hypothetical protein M430DRAFT_212642 [Amorphotheca resinae ATCC 22711]
MRGGWPALISSLRALVIIEAAALLGFFDPHSFMSSSCLFVPPLTASCSHCAGHEMYISGKEHQKKNLYRKGTFA